MKKLLIVLAVLLLAGASFAGVQQTRLLEVMLANVQILDDYKLIFGTGSDASIEFDEDGTDQLRITGSTIFEDVVAFDSALTFTGGYSVPDDVAITFGTGLDASIEYDEDGTDQLRIAGAAIFEDAVEFDSALAIDAGGVVGDDQTVAFGAGSDWTFAYDETTTDDLLVTAASANSLFNILIGNFVVGAGTPGQTLNGVDAYISGLLEVDGVLYTDGGVLIPDDIALTFGTDSDASLTYDEAVSDVVVAAGKFDFSDVAITDSTAGLFIEADVPVTFGNDSDATMMYDETTLDRTLLTTVAGSGFNIVAGNLYVGDGAPGQTVNGEDAYIEGLVEIDGVAYLDGGAKIGDDIAMTFGADSDATIMYDETTDDTLEITSTNINMTGAVGVTGAVVGTSTITSSATGSLGWSIVAGANTACNTTCTFACAAGQDADAANVLVACDNAAADLCICAGAN